MTVLPLHEWETFYVIIGSSAAALTGLQFVVIALGGERQLPGSAEALSAFGTPTIVHFCCVLTVAAIVAVPHQTSTSLSVCLTTLGLAGVIYAIIVTWRARKQSGYKPVLEDWLWHSGFPLASYVALLVAGIAAKLHPEGALYVVAATTLFLLFIGIHNAWDSAVYIATTMRRSD